MPGETKPKLGEKESNIILKSGMWWAGETPDHDGWFIERIIITPTVFKEKYYAQKPFMKIWQQAKIALSQCDKLVVVGYSFRDFTAKQLFLESFVSNSPKEIVVVDPDHDLVGVVKELCHFDEVIWFSSLEEYLQTFSELVNIENEPR